MQSLWLIILAVFLVILIIPIFAKVYLSFDLFKNIGTISLYIFSIRILVYKIKYKNKEIIFYTEKNKKDVPITVSNYQLRFINKFSTIVKEKVILKSIVFNSRIGLNNAFDTAILNGLVNSFICGLFSYIKLSKKSAKLIINSNPDYNGNKFMISSQVCSFVTIFDIIYSIIVSIVSLRRELKKVKQN